MSNAERARQIHDLIKNRTREIQDFVVPNRTADIDRVDRIINESSAAIFDNQVKGENASRQMTERISSLERLNRESAA
jgi:hypothetical protein